MKRNWICLFLVLSVFLTLSLPAMGTEAVIPALVDNADLLSGGQEAELVDQLAQQREKLELEIVIVTTNDLEGKDVQAYADDFYDQYGYGYGEDNSGILLLLSMESREWYISTCGEAIYIFTDYGLAALGDALLPYLSEGDYFTAFSHWISGLEMYVESYRAGAPVDGYAEPDEYGSENEEIVYYHEPMSGTTKFLISGAVGFVAALTTILVMRSAMNTAKLRSGAGDYLKDGSFRLTRCYDMFLYSRVSRTAKPKNNGSGSSVHRSSGGVSHGGRGGRF